VAGAIADQLQWANQRRLEFAGYAVPVRLARVMVELVDRHGFRTDQGHELGIELSQTELGRLIGAGEDAVGQAMRQLRRSGLVTPHYRKVTINDLHDLRLFGELS
jgi:CRP-like cAMP-binding protein